MPSNIVDDKRKEILLLQAELCKSLADPKRLMIIDKLRDGEKSVGELTRYLGINQSNTSQHLAILRKAGVIISHKQGNIVYYNLSNPKIAAACNMVYEIIAEKLQHDKALAGVV